MFFQILRTRSVKATCKAQAVKLLLGLVKMSFDFICMCYGRPPQFIGTVITKAGKLVAETLDFDSFGFCRDWSNLLRHSRCATKLWEGLRKSIWHGRCISTTPDQASLEDIFFFLAFISSHPKLKEDGQVAWLVIGKVLLPPLIQLAGSWLDAWAFHLSKQTLKELPLLKSKFGNAAKQLDPVNRMLVLYRIRREKVHRRRVALSHEGLVPLQSTWARLEHTLDTVQHLKALQLAFSDHPHQLNCCWDPASYSGGKSTFVGVFYSQHLGKGGYLMNQQVAKLMQSEVSEFVLDQSKKSKLARVEGYNELRGLCSSLWHSTGFKLEDFKVPEGFVLRPIRPGELRVQGKDGRYYLYDTATKVAIAELPQGCNLSAIPVLCSVSDQGPNNMAALSFLQFSPEAIMTNCQWDCFHRSWNDIKGSAKKCTFKAWRVILELVTFFNVNFGPFGSQQWWWRKRAMLEEFVSKETFHGPTWQRYQHDIAKERRLTEPDNHADQAKLFGELHNLQNFLTKGPLVKLMRWFSFFQCCLEWEGEFLMTKMVMESGLRNEGQQDDEPVEDEVAEPRGKDDKTQLAELKKRKGTFVLAPTLVTSRTLCTKDILMSVGRATWKTHSERAREVVSPADTMKVHIACGAQQDWKFELAEMVRDSLLRQETLLHLTKPFATHEMALEWHVEFFFHLLEARAMSLASFHSLPPLRYAHCLSSIPQVQKSAANQALADLEALLAAERADCHMKINALDTCFWRVNPLSRCILLAFQQDQEHGSSHAAHLMGIICKGYGDTKVVENCHQFQRDLQRSSKSATHGNVKIMSNTLKSGCLEGRKAPLVQPQAQDKVMADGSFVKESVAKKLTSSGFKLPPEVQKMMLPKTKASGNEWPSPTPATLFKSVAATEWLFTFFQKAGKFPGKSANSSWYSVLARKGWLLAQESTSLVAMTVASAPFGLLAWQATPKTGRDGVTMFFLDADHTLLQWHHITDLNDWKLVPSKAALVSDRGPIGFVKTGEAVPLHWQVCLEGADLVVTHLKDIIESMGGIPQGYKKQLQTQLIRMTLPADLQEAALQNIAAKEAAAAEQDEVDSELSEILSDLDKEEGNAMEIKDLKKKRRKYAKGKPVDKPLAGPKAKAKAKAKGKAKAKAKQKPGFAQRLLNKQGQKADAKAAGPEPEPVDVAMPQAPEADQKVDAKAVAPEPESVDVAMPQAPEADTALGGEDLFGPSLTLALDKPLPEPVEIEGGGPSSSSASGGPGASQGESTEGAQAQPADGKGVALRKAAPKVYRTPEDLLSSLAPPGTTFTVNQPKHMFASLSRLDATKLDHPYNQKSFSQSFGDRRPWEEALRRVHEYNWKKWSKLREQAPLPPGAEEQAPGKISQEVLDEVAKFVEQLPPKTATGKAAKPK
eukprot:Skav235470  [mRNA]  locus=scaffold1269:62205:66386:- [translate_table: standard]